MLDLFRSNSRELEIYKNKLILFLVKKLLVSPLAVKYNTRGLLLLNIVSGTPPPKGHSQRLKATACM